MNTTAIGLDLARNALQVYGIDVHVHGKKVIGKSPTRKQVLPYSSPPGAASPDGMNSKERRQVEVHPARDLPLGESKGRIRQCGPFAGNVGLPRCGESPYYWPGVGQDGTP